MEIPVGDLLDRFAIARLKAVHLDDEDATAQMTALGQAIDKLAHEHVDWNLHEYVRKLTDVNQEIWGYESDLRQGKLKKYQVDEFLTTLGREELLQYAAVGLAAVRIRDANKKRKSIINELVELTKTGWKEVKVNHASE